MKKSIKFIIISLIVITIFHGQSIYAAEIPVNSVSDVEIEDILESSDESQVSNSVYDITISFHKNGGKGSMDSMICADETAKLTKNSFSRKGFKFSGWNTKEDGTGIAYTDEQIIDEIIKETADEQIIILYAQWELKQPTIKKANSPNPEIIKINYAKNAEVSGYEIQYATNKSFKNALETIAKGNSTSTQILNILPDKKYYIRMRSYSNDGGQKKYSNWSKILSVKTKKGSTIVNTKSYMSIEADVKMNGSGSGFHAKLVMATPNSAVSYGIQYDKHAQAPYTGRAMAMIENVSTNNAGGQRYTRPGDKELSLNRNYHLMMTIDENGNGNVYLNYEKIGSFSQPNLVKETCYLRIESSARLNGDSVDTIFSNIKCKWNGNFNPNKVLGQGLSWTEFNQNPGLKYKIQKDGSIRIYGKIRGISGDWDSDYNRVSEILQFN